MKTIIVNHSQKKIYNKIIFLYLKIKNVFMIKILFYYYLITFKLYDQFINENKSKFVLFLIEIILNKYLYKN